MKYPEEQMCIDKGYKFLGWQISSNNEDLKKCIELGHMNWKRPEGKCTGHKQHNPRGSDCTDWCDECKIYYKTDMSD